jgi:chemotaxis protein CheD
MSAPVSDPRRIAVGIGHIEFSGDREDVLVAYGLGSCVAVSIFDPATHLAGMAHILLPASDGRAPSSEEPARFADTGIDSLIAGMVARGSIAARCLVKAAGGASVLGQVHGGKFKIGERNAEAIKEQLVRHGLRLSASALGGTHGRTLELHVASGKTLVRTAASPARDL